MDCFTVPRLGEAGPLADQCKLLVQPRFEIGEDGEALFLSDRMSLVGAASADVLLARMKDHDAFKRLASDRREAGDGEFINLSRPCDHEGRVGRRPLA